MLRQQGQNSAQRNRLSKSNHIESCIWDHMHKFVATWQDGVSDNVSVCNVIGAMEITRRMQGDDCPRLVHVAMVH